MMMRSSGRKARLLNIWKTCAHFFEVYGGVHKILGRKVVVNNDMAAESQGEKSPLRLVMDKNPMDWNLFRPRLRHTADQVGASLKRHGTPDGCL